VVLRAGARPVFADVDPATRNIDLNLMEQAITPRTRALLPVDLAGLPVDRDRLYDIARRHKLRVLEDAAQSMGANWQGRRIGSCGDLVSISFHPNKNMTTTEGGCLVLNDAAEARQTELWRLQGVERFADGGIEVTLPGGKHNMTDVAARVGLGQLPRLEAFNARRRLAPVLRPSIRRWAGAAPWFTQQLAHSGAAARRRPRRVHCDMKARASASACIPAMHLFRSSANSAGARGSSRTPSASAPAS
jgi:dTDP-4-amino-4,6-dideoxygalactose transaminase